MTNRIILLKAFVLLFVVSISGNLDAAVVAIPTANVTASSELTSSPFTRIDDHLVDGSGLTAGGHGVAPDSSMWLSTASGFGGIDADPFVTFDLGAVYTINNFHVWNYNEAGALSNRGVNAVTVQYGETPALGSTVAGVSNFTQASGAAGYTGENFSGFAPFEARYVKFDIDSNHGDGSSFYGLSEVQFDVEPISGVTVESFSSELTGFGGRTADETINGSGFNSATGVHNNDAADMWLTKGTAFEGGGDPLPDAFITYDLGDNYDLNSLNVWNYNEVNLTNRGAQNVEISVASEEGGAFISLGNFVFDQAPGTSGDFGQLIDLTSFLAADDVRLVRLDINSNWGDGDQVVGLSEIRFVGTQVVPEPATFVLAAFGLALVGLACYRRRSAA